MKYFFVLGINPALSVAEISAVLPGINSSLVAADFLLSDISQEINAPSLIKSLGGTIKIGLIHHSIPKQQGASLLGVIQDMVIKKQGNSDAGKFNFGFSDYGSRSFDKKDLGAKLKKYLSGREISSRFVVSREKTLSSVVVEQNKLLKRGMEIVLAEHEGEILIGETLSVQAFKDLSLRDFGRPARDDHSGMLPPKLAQIMINLAQINNQQELIMDPFCGSGTILSEALLLGFKNIFGSDISAKAIDDTYKNISWTKELYKITDAKTKLFTKSVLNLEKFIKASSVSAIITEPFLGPQRGLINFQQVRAELETLYSAALKQFQTVLVPGGRVVMVWPLFYGQKPISPSFAGFKMIEVLPANLKNNPLIKKNMSASRPSFIYGRPGQKVYREIIILEKI